MNHSKTDFAETFMIVTSFHIYDNEAHKFLYFKKKKKEVDKMSDFMSKQLNLHMELLCHFNSMGKFT